VPARCSISAAAVGRHALFLAEHGLAVEALDGSAAGLAVMRETAQARRISLGVRQGTPDALPFDDASFDLVLSWNVIHHGSVGDVGRRLGRDLARAEARRALPGHDAADPQHQLRTRPYRRPRHTVVRDRAEDRGRPHFYCDAATLVALYAGFEGFLMNSMKCGHDNRAGAKLCEECAAPWRVRAAEPTFADRQVSARSNGIGRTHLMQPHFEPWRARAR
jgi:tellurite methyltransferase